METIRLYAHDDPAPGDRDEAIEDDIEAHPGVTPSKIRTIHERNPLMEVGFDFDLTTGECVKVIVEGKEFQPAEGA